MAPIFSAAYERSRRLGPSLALLFGSPVPPERLCLGLFETMMPASVIDMYGGMFFGMRDSMAAGSRTTGAAAVGGLIVGLAVVLALELYDKMLRDVVVEAGE